jgi:hypothetical protein
MPSSIAAAADGKAIKELLSFSLAKRPTAAAFLCSVPGKENAARIRSGGAATASSRAWCALSCRWQSHRFAAAQVGSCSAAMRLWAAGCIKRRAEVGRQLEGIARAKAEGVYKGRKAFDRDCSLAFKGSRSRYGR